MKKTILLVMFVMVASITLAQKIYIKDSYGNTTGYYQRDYFDNSKINIYDNTGALVQTAKEDIYGNITYSDNTGANTGKTKQYGDKTTIYDKYGNPIGYYKMDYFSDKINVFNSYGVQVGYYKKNYFSGNLEYFNY